MIKKINKEKVLKCAKNVAIMSAYAIITVALVNKFGYATSVSDGDASNQLFGRAQYILDQVKKGLLGLSAGAVTIAVACGVFMKKFSMGKQDKIEVGNKLIRDSIVGFVVLNSMTYITSFIMTMSKEADSHTVLSSFQGKM